MINEKMPGTYWVTGEVDVTESGKVGEKGVQRGIE